MKLLWCCLLAAFVTVSSAALDVEKTVKQVQSILKTNQLLPRLTRDEILQLLNDIRAEDAKSASKESKENKNESSSTPYSTIENEVNPQENNSENTVTTTDKNIVTSPTPAPLDINPTTKKNEPTLMVVLPYTPRDGSSLQELYTRPPRTEVVKIPSTTPKPKTSKPASNQNKVKPNDLPQRLIDNFPDELQAFLDAHGLQGKPGQDHFLLPLEGFKPLPPARIVDGSVELPENILLTYDLISPNTDAKTKNNGAYSLSPNNFLYEPLRPELPFELDVSSSETKEVSLPYDMPVKKAKTGPTLNYDPIDYDSVKVIPLSKGINPVNEQINTSNEQSKRQTEDTTAAVTETTPSSTTTEEPKTNAVTDSSVSADDPGASIADLEDSFGGAAPSLPGDSELPPPRKNGFYWMLDWNSFLEVGDGDTKVNIRFEPKLGDPQMFLPVTVP